MTQPELDFWLCVAVLAGIPALAYLVTAVCMIVKNSINRSR